MDVFECMEKRRSIRNYDKKDVPNELIAQIITAGTYAPSAGNVQPWEFVIIQDKKTKKELATAALRQEHIEEAPVVIVVLANKEKSRMRYGERGENLYCIQDTAVCIQNMLLACTALGLGTCWTGAFEEEEVKQLLCLPDKLRPVAILPIGFQLPYEKPMRTDRIPFENITWEEKYGKELSWVMKYGRKRRFGWEPIDYQIKKLREKKKEEKKVEKEKPKKKKENYPERFIRFIKNLPK